MKSYLYLFFFITTVVSAQVRPSTFSTASSQTSWLWAKQVIGNGTDMAFATANDNNGNTYITGAFGSDTLQFDTIGISPFGQQDIFIAKYGPAGNVLWAKNAGGVSMDGGYGITCDNLGNVYVTGLFSSIATFDTISIPNQFGTRLFIAKYDSDGTILWVKSPIGTGNDFSKAVTTDNSGNVYITGHFASDTLVFDTITLISTTGAEMFLAKYNAAGNVVWAVKAAGNVSVDGRSLVVDQNENVFVTGNFVSDTVWFDTIMLLNDTTDGSDDFYLAKYDSNGNIVWAKRAGGSKDDQSVGIGIDDQGNSYIAGDFFSDTISFGSTTFVRNGPHNFFLAKYNSLGNPVWARSNGGNSNEDCSSITSDANGNIFITGKFYSATISIGTYTLTNNANLSSDIYVAGYDTAGNVLFATSGGGISGDNVYGITSDDNGSVYITGSSLSPMLNFGSTTLLLDSANSFEVYLARLDLITGIHQLFSESDFIVYPNPFSHEIVVQNTDEQPLSFTIYNILGETILSRTLFEKKNRVDLSSVTDHFFLYTLEKDNVVVKTGKMIKE